MKEEIRLSVVVPVYDLEKELPRCVESIRRQTHRNLEILLVDDGSRDGSRALIERMAREDPRIVPIFRENGGASAARLTGAAAATGEYVGFVDGDDEIEPEMFEMLLTLAEEYRADIAHCGFQMVFPDGRVRMYNGSGRLAVQDREQALRDLILGVYEPGLWNKLFRRELIETLLNEVRMDLSIRLNEDLLMNWYLFRQAARSVYLDECPYRYRVRSGSASRAPRGCGFLDPLRVKEILLAEAEPALRPDAERALLATCATLYGASTVDAARREPEQARLRETIRRHRAALPLLPGRQRLLAVLIDRAPGIVRKLYPIYSRYLQKKKYE